MSRKILVFGTALLGVGAWFFFQRFQIDGLGHLTLHSRGDASSTQHGGQVGPPAVQRPNGTIRIATFNVQTFGPAKLNQPRVMNLLADTVRHFDVVAVQEISARTDDVLPRLMDLVNADGRHYEYLVGPRLGRSGQPLEQYAFIFDRASIEADRTSLYTVQDPDDVMLREPLVAGFRVRGPPPEEAFTFTLVNVHVDSEQTTAELNALAEVFRAVRDDGRREDDVILLGDLNADDRHLGRLGESATLVAAISGLPSNTRGDRQLDNIIFSRLATQEYTGRSGVMDLIRELNLTTDDALQVSDHLPVWAEFSIYEGGQAGRIADSRPVWKDDATPSGSTLR